MYQALYREFRPMTFESSVGQEAIVKILKNQIEQNKTSHAYLFTGVRGTGKTSFAKIFARAVNCLNQKNGEPCNVCENCLAILNNDTTDVVEMDAASNTSVDDIRKIIDEMYFVPAKLNYRVYIIDEAHMLSNSAWNAFLKSLEEPPKHVKFILATTEPQKLLPTILSRCQRFDFKRIDEEVIFKYLTEISKKVDIKLNVDSLRLIANLADGSMRDGISILESMRAFDKVIEVEDIRSVIGIPSFDDIIILITNIINNNEQEVANVACKLINEGKEANNILVEMLKVLESMVIGSKESLVRYTKSEIELISNIRNIKDLRIYDLIKDVSRIYSDLKYANNKNTIFIASVLALTNNNYTEQKDNIEFKGGEKEIKTEKQIETKLRKKENNNEQKEVEKVKNIDWNAVMQNLSAKREIRILLICIKLELKFR